MAVRTAAPLAPWPAGQRAAFARRRARAGPYHRRLQHDFELGRESSRCVARSAPARTARDRGRSCRAQLRKRHSARWSRAREPARATSCRCASAVRPVARARARACRPPSSDAAAAVGDDRVELKRARRCWPRGPVRLRLHRPQVIARHALLGKQCRCAHDGFPAPDGPTSTTRHGAGNATDSASSVPSGRTPLLGRAHSDSRPTIVIRVEKPALAVHLAANALA